MAIPLAVVGLGERGLQWVAEIGRVPGFELVAACDPSAAARARAIATGLPHTAVHADLEAACAHGHPAAALVATAVHAHAAPAAEAIDRGLAVLVEKPFASSVAEARALVDRASRARVPLLVGQNYRYLRWVRAARRLVSQGEVGDLVSVSLAYHREGHAVSQGLAQTDAAALWETGIHHLDMVRWLLPGTVTSVSAHGSTPPGRAALRGTTWHVLLRLDTTVPVSYALSWDSAGHGAFERGQQFYARFGGTRGTLHVLQRWLLLCRRGRWPAFVRRGPRPATEEAQVLARFEAAIARGEETELSGRDNLASLALAEAAARSAAEGRSVDPRALLRDA